jgi:hypothetical protein
MATIPSLALIPSGYKASKVYSVLPNDGTGDFDFTRSSSATRVNKEGLIELVGSNVPRLNYPLIDGVVQGCPSLLLEPARTNLATYSEQFDNAAWTKFGGVVLANTETSPDGAINSDTLQGDSSTVQIIISQGKTLSAGQFTSSIFAKAGTANFLELTFDNFVGASNISGVFDLSNGTTSSVGAIIQSFNNGWYRCSLTATIVSGDVVGSLGYRIRPNAANIFYPNAAATNGQNVFLYGAQIEAGSYPTSYIKSNSGSATTRSAETCNNAGDVNTFNDSEGVLMAEISALDNPTSQEVALSVSEGQSGANRLLIRMKTNGEIGIVLRVANTNEAIIDSGTLNQLSNHKVAVKWKVNDIALWIDGVEVGTDNSANVFTANTLNEISFNQGNNSNFFYGNAKQIQYFDSALTDSELETLTSWTSFSEMATSQLYTIE